MPVKKRFGVIPAECWNRTLHQEGKNYCADTDELLRQLDVLVDGASIEELKDITLRFRGSSISG